MGTRQNQIRLSGSHGGGSCCLGGKGLTGDLDQYNAHIGKKIYIYNIYIYRQYIHTYDMIYITFRDVIIVSI